MDHIVENRNFETVYDNFREIKNFFGPHNFPKKGAMAKFVFYFIFLKLI